MLVVVHVVCIAVIGLVKPELIGLSMQEVMSAGNSANNPLGNPPIRFGGGPTNGQFNPMIPSQSIPMNREGFYSAVWFCLNVKLNFC